MVKSWQNKKVLVLGMGVSGKAAADFLLQRGALVTGVDQQPDPSLKQEGLTLVSETEKIDVSDFDAMIVSPGIHPDHPLYHRAQEKKMIVIGEAELALRECQLPAVGITGTNGKTTVTMMVKHVLNHSGVRAKAVGNIGESLTKEVNNTETDTTLVVELSSFQLETLASRVFDEGVILNVSADHLERYINLKAYAEAKGRIIQCLRRGGELIVSNHTLNAFPEIFEEFPVCSFGFDDNCTCYSDGEYLIYKKSIEFLLPLQYREVFSHDVENMLAAYCICRRHNVKPEMFFEALNTFIKPPHRLEFVRKIAGVAYYNDSKGTNIDAVQRAVEAMKGKTILIAGGVDKGAAYTPWKQAFAEKVKCVCAIGEAKYKIQHDLLGAVTVNLHATLEEAVSHAQSLAKPGDNVLLSPGCSSFDMFNCYSHRGDSFKKIVNALSLGSSV